MKKVILLSFILLFIGACEKKRCVQDNRELNLTEASICEDQLIEGIKKGFKAGICYIGPVTKGIDYIGPIIKSMDISISTIKNTGRNDTACIVFYEKAKYHCLSVPPHPTKMKKLNQLLKKGTPKCSECPKCDPIYLDENFK